MENEMSNEATMNSDQVTLQLPGIDKRWAWVKNRGWVDLDEIKSPTIEIQEENESKSSPAKKWWKFW